MLLSSSAKMLTAAAWMFQQSGSGWNPMRVWGDMQWPARTVVVILGIMSAWSIGVMMDRWMAYRAARKQSLQFAPMVAGALRQGNLDEIINTLENLLQDAPGLAPYLDLYCYHKILAGEDMEKTAAMARRAMGAGRKGSATLHLAVALEAYREHAEATGTQRRR